MTATETFRRRFSVGKYQVAVSANLVGGKAVGVQIHGSPDTPRRLSPTRLTIDRQKRNYACTALAAQLGGTIAMVDDLDKGQVVLTTLFPAGRIAVQEIRS